MCFGVTIKTSATIPLLLTRRHNQIGTFKQLLPLLHMKRTELWQQLGYRFNFRAIESKYTI